MESGTISNAMYGGSNSEGTVSGSVYINIKGGTIGASGTSADRVFGGGQGQPTIVSGKTTIKITDEKNNVSIYGNIYGGSAFGKVGGNAAVSVKDTSSATNTISLSGDIYGGGSLADCTTSNVDIGNVTVNNVYGGGNYGAVGINNSSTTSTTMKIMGGTINGSVYGGGKISESGVYGLLQCIYCDFCSGILCAESI